MVSRLQLRWDKFSQYTLITRQYLAINLSDQRATGRFSCLQYLRIVFNAHYLHSKVIIFMFVRSHHYSDLLTFVFSEYPLGNVQSVDWNLHWGLHWKVSYLQSFCLPMKVTLLDYQFNSALHGSWLTLLIYEHSCVHPLKCDP